MAAGNLDHATFEDDQGRQVCDFRVDLWFFLRDAPEHDRIVRVHEGQFVEIPDYRIRVAEINPSDKVIVFSIARTRP